MRLNNKDTITDCSLPRHSCIRCPLKDECTLWYTGPNDATSTWDTKTTENKMLDIEIVGNEFLGKKIGNDWEIPKWMNR